MITITATIAHSNKRQRTITINYMGSLYKTEQLTKEEFDYYTNYATKRDLLNLIRNSNAREVNR